MYGPIQAGSPMHPITEHVARSQRHTSFYLACGAPNATPLIFVHGWPELSRSWRHQLPAFAAFGFRCIAPDMRGYGRSSNYTRHEDFALEGGLPLIDRSIYPEAEYPVGQWDYQYFYVENFEKAHTDFEANIHNVV